MLSEQVKLSTPEAGLKSITHQFRKHPRLQGHVKVSPSDVISNAELAWYRGQHSGWIDAYNILKTKHKRAASHLLKQLGMDEIGVIKY